MIPTCFLQRWLLIGACLWSTATAASLLTGVSEVDLLFPRNDTYAPMPLMPIVFAVQRPPIVDQLLPQISYSVHPRHLADGEYARYHTIDLSLPSNDSTYFIAKGVANLTNVPGSWQFSWALRFYNCSTTDDPKWQDQRYDSHDQVDNGFHLGYFYPLQHIFFTTHGYGPQLDLVAITGGDGCNKTQHLIFDVEESLQIPSSLQDGDSSLRSCVSLPSSSPTPRPCLASLKPEEASSISASLTRSQCSEATPAINCPPTETDSSACSNSVSRRWWLTCGVVCSLLVLA